MFKNDDYIFEPAYIKLGRYLMGFLMVGIFGFFLFLDQLVEAPKPYTYEQLRMIDEIERDFEQQLYNESFRVNN